MREGSDQCLLFFERCQYYNLIDYENIISTVGEGLSVPGTAEVRPAKFQGGKFIFQLQMFIIIICYI